MTTLEKAAARSTNTVTAERPIEACHSSASRTAKWREDGVVERAMWTEAAEAGLLCLSMPEEYGGAGGDYRHEVILMEQMAAKAVDGFGAEVGRFVDVAVADHGVARA